MPTALGCVAALVVVGARHGSGSDVATLLVLAALSCTLALTTHTRQATTPAAERLANTGGVAAAFGATALAAAAGSDDPPSWLLPAGSASLVACLVLGTAFTASEAAALVSPESRRRALLDSFLAAALIAATGWNLLLMAGQTSSDHGVQLLHVSMLVFGLAPTSFAAMAAVNDPTDRRFSRLAFGFAATVLTLVAGILGPGLERGPQVVEPMAAFAMAYLAVGVATRSDGRRPQIDAADRLQRRRRVISVLQGLYIVSLGGAMTQAGEHVVMGSLTISVLLLLAAVQRSAGRENVQLQRLLAQQLRDLAESEDRFRRMAWTDELTSLMNRRAIVDQIGFELGRSHRCAVLFVDLDRFKEVNDTLGHDAGDELLVVLAERIVAAVGPTGSVGRFGGDEFVVLVSDAPSERAAVAVGERVLEAVAEPVDLGGTLTYLAASIGIARATAESSPTRLLSDADAAMYEAKSQGRNRIVVFSDALGQRTEERMRVANDLHRGIDAGELVVHYQPIVHLADDRTRGFEALVRWNHPERGLVPPGLFLDVAEDTGLIVPLGAHVLRTACHQLADWQRRGLVSRRASVSVNLAPRQLADPGLAAVVIDTLTESGLAPENLVLEITESALMSDAAAVDRTIETLSGLGVLFSVDDFGTGYSSLTYLKRFPVQVLKIDRDFVDGLPHQSGDVVIVDAVVSLARGMALLCVAEGVESIEQADYLRSIGCEYAQGYLFARPMPATEVESWLTTHPSVTSV